MEEEYYILFINGEPIDCQLYDKGVYKLEDKIFDIASHPFKITESIYRNETIDNGRELHAYCEYHDGCWAPAYTIEDRKHNIIDIKIIENLSLNKYKDVLNQDYLKEFCKKFKIKKGD